MTVNSQMVVRTIDGALVSGTVNPTDGSFWSEDGTIEQLADGFVIHGKTLPDNTFLARDVVDGKTLWGNFGPDHSFLSKDGTTYVTAGGVEEFGITDPAGNFLKDGVVRTIEGVQVYGTVNPQDGSFISADGTLLQFADGFVIHGKTLPDNTFLAYKVVDGKTLWGNYGLDHSFLSQQGTTFVTADGVEEFGITDPAGNFLKDGVVRNIPGVGQVYGTVDPKDGSFISEDGTILQLADGFVIHGKTLPDNTFLAEDVVDGKTLWGTVGKDHSFLSQDGTTFVTADGVEEFGITDPAGNFIQNGVKRTLPDGTVLYGTVDPKDGSFINEDGTILILADGFVIHGKTLPDNTFLAYNPLVNLWGSFGPDHSFLSQDGTTYVTADGVVEHGITDAAGNFIQNGVKETLPDGTVVYGTMVGNTFISENNNIIILPNNTVVTGTYDPGTGILTGTNGSYYFVGTDGIVSATPEPDGSFQLPDGSIVMTPHAWAVDLPAFLNTISTVQFFADLINIATATISAQYSTIEAAWQSPAGMTFSDCATLADSTMAQLNIMLSDMVQAMKTSYQNYLQAEAAAMQAYFQAEAAAAAAAATHNSGRQQ